MNLFWQMQYEIPTAVDAVDFTNLFIQKPTRFGYKYKNSKIQFKQTVFMIVMVLKNY